MTDDTKSMYHQTQTQSPEWMILSQVDCFIQGQVIRVQVLLDSLHPRSTSEGVVVASSSSPRGKLL